MISLFDSKHKDKVSFGMESIEGIHFSLTPDFLNFGVYRIDYLKKDHSEYYTKLVWVKEGEIEYISPDGEKHPKIEEIVRVITKAIEYGKSQTCLR